MEEFSNVIKSFDEEKKKKFFAELFSSESAEDIMNVCKNYNLNISKEQAAKIYEGCKNGDKLGIEELSKMAGGASYSYYVSCI